MVRHRLLLVVLLPSFLALSMTATASAQQTAPSSRTAASGGGATKIILTTLSAPSGDTVAEKLASTITSSLEVMMKLSGTLTVRRADFLAPSVALSRARRYYSEVNADGAVYGSVAPTSNGGYRIVLGLWNGSTPNAAPELFHRTISNVLTSFTMADRLALAVTSTIVGHPLHEGTLQLKNTKLLPNYAVYADGHLLARNRSVLPLLAGKREVVIAKPGGPLGDVPVEVFHVRIRGGRTTTAKLSAKEIAAGTNGTRLAPSPTAKPLLPAAFGPNQGNPVPAPTGVATIRVHAWGRLFVDGKERGVVNPGVARQIRGLSLGHHSFLVRYAGGHVDTGGMTFTVFAKRFSVDFSYSYPTVGYRSRKLFQSPVLSVEGSHYTLRSPRFFLAGFRRLSKLPQMSSSTRAQIGDAEKLIRTWRVQRAVHWGALALFWGAIGYGLLNTNPQTSGASAAVAGIGALISIPVIIFNAYHRGRTVGELTSDTRLLSAALDASRTAGQ